MSVKFLGGAAEEVAISRPPERSQRHTNEGRLNNVALEASESSLSPRCTSRTSVRIPMGVASALWLGIVPQSRACSARGHGSD